MTRGLGGESPANVADYLKGIDFPANREQLLEHAQNNGTGQAVLERLKGLPDSNFENMADVMKGYGQES